LQVDGAVLQVDRAPLGPHTNIGYDTKSTMCPDSPALCPASPDSCPTLTPVYVVARMWYVRERWRWAVSYGARVRNEPVPNRSLCRRLAFFSARSGVTPSQLPALAAALCSASALRGLCAQGCSSTRGAGLRATLSRLLRGSKSAIPRPALHLKSALHPSLARAARGFGQVA
jgi:hypothetical protein